MDSKDCETGAVQKLTSDEPSYPKRQDWTEFKGRIFKVASMVVLPKNKRVCTRAAGGSMKAKTPCVSVKSLPQLKQEESVKSKLLRRSISEQPQPTICDDSSPQQQRSRKIKFSPLPEDEEEVDSSGSSTTGNLSDVDKQANKHKNKAFAPGRRCRKSETSTDVIPLMPNEDEAQIILPDDIQACMPMMRRDFPPRDITTREYARKSLDNSIDDDSSLDEKEDEKSMEETEVDLSYSCMPPPIFMLSITITEVAFFIYHAKRLVNDPKYGYISKFSPAPLDSRLIYDPTRRYEIWRYLTYALVHSGYMHIINNVVVQLVLGILLEMVHEWWRVLAIYFAGVLAGSLATSITEPFNYLAGASAGVYALIAAHLSTVILNWPEMEYPWIRVLVFAAFVIHDGGTALYYGYFMGEKTNVGYAAHLGGAVAGLLVGIHVLKNLKWRYWEKVLWWLCVFICIILLVFAIVWNIVRTDLFP